jgi:hypothetical protein
MRPPGQVSASERRRRRQESEHPMTRWCRDHDGRTLQGAGSFSGCNQRRAQQHDHDHQATVIRAALPLRASSRWGNEQHDRRRGAHPARAMGRWLCLPAQISHPRLFGVAATPARRAHHAGRSRPGSGAYILSDATDSIVYRLVRPESQERGARTSERGSARGKDGRASAAAARGTRQGPVSKRGSGLGHAARTGEQARQRPGACGKGGRASAAAAGGMRRGRASKRHSGGKHAARGVEQAPQRPGALCLGLFAWRLSRSGTPRPGERERICTRGHRACPLPHSGRHQRASGMPPCTKQPPRGPMACTRPASSLALTPSENHQ